MWKRAMYMPGECMLQAEGIVRGKGNEARECVEYSRNRKDVTAWRTEQVKGR